MNQKRKPSERRYSSDEVADIIRLSLQGDNQDKTNSVDYEELLTIARDVGVDSEQIDQAVRLLEEEQQTKEKEQLLWQRFNAHAILFAAVNLFLVSINVLADSDYFWSMYVVFGWGLFLLGHYLGLRYAPQFVELAMQHTRRIGSSTYQGFLDSEDQVIFVTTDPMYLSETQGMISADDEHVVIEYQTVDSMLGLIKTGVKVVEIPFSDVASARVEQKLWSTEFVLQGKNMRAIGNVPGASKGSMRVKIARGSTGAASALVDEICKKIS